MHDDAAVDSYKVVPEGVVEELQLWGHGRESQNLEGHVHHLESSEFSL